MNDEECRKIDCAEACRKMFAYLDGDLTPERAAEIESHLARCGRCADSSEAERKLLAAIRASDAGSTDLALRARILEAIRAAPPRNPAS